MVPWRTLVTNQRFVRASYARPSGHDDESGSVRRTRLRTIGAALAASAAVIGCIEGSGRNVASSRSVAMSRVMPITVKRVNAISTSAVSRAAAANCARRQKYSGCAGQASVAAIMRRCAVTVSPAASSVEASPESRRASAADSAADCTLAPCASAARLIPKMPTPMSTAACTTRRHDRTVFSGC